MKMDHEDVKNRLLIALGTLALIRHDGNEILQGHIDEAMEAIKKAHHEVEHDHKLQFGEN
jgi:hypothetical protein